MIVCAGKIESFDFAKAIGIGLVDSAINLTHLIHENSPKELIFIGTCGLYKDGKILKIYKSTEASNVEISNLLNFSYSPILENLNVKSCEKLCDVSYETYKTNSSNFITTNSKMADKFYKMGFFMENMELFSVIRVANLFKIPAKGFLCATNFCDEKAHEDFKKNHKQANQLLEKFMKDKGYI